MAEFEHKFNPLHVYCRLCNKLGKRLARAICKTYEFLVYRQITAILTFIRSLEVTLWD